MDGMFSIEEISKELWTVDSPVSSSTNINRSSSEWTFENFLEEASASIPRSSFRSSSSSLPADNLAKNGGVNVLETRDILIYPEEFQTGLKDQLSVAYGSVPRTGILCTNLQKSILSAEKGSLALDTRKSWLEEFENGHLQTENDVTNGPLGAPDLSLVQRNSAVQARPTTSGSSRELSDDEELEADMENIETVGMTDIKRMRRMISNRESARRSRRRKQAHLTELETQVSQLKVEKSSLMKRLADISQKYNESSVDSRILKADVETLRAKVKMAEDSVKRVTGMSLPFLHTVPNLSSFNVPFSINPDVPANISLPVNENLNHFFQASQTQRNINDIANTFVPLSRMEDVHNTGGNLD